MFHNYNNNLDTPENRGIALTLADLEDIQRGYPSAYVESNPQPDTYYVKQRNLQPNCVFLFKRESSKTAYVPLTSYLTYGFDLTYRKKPVKKYAFRFQIEHLREIYDIFYAK